VCSSDLIALLNLIIISGCALKDDRLSGKWRSDLELTTNFNENHAILTERQKKLFSQLFGQMEVTYLRPGQCEVFMPKNKTDTGNKAIESDESKVVSEFKIIYKNENQIVILYNDCLLGKKVSILNFDNDNTYWIYIGESGLFDTHIREYFKKIE
jgi:hypothetical protein